MIKKNMCCRQVAIAKMVQFLGARRASLRDAVWNQDLNTQFVQSFLHNFIIVEKCSQSQCLKVAIKDILLKRNS